jgi:hypothetical protein
VNGPEPPRDPDVVNVGRANLCLYVLDRIHAAESATSNPRERLRRAVAVVVESRLLTRWGHELGPIEEALGCLARDAAGESPFEELR